MCTAWKDRFRNDLYCVGRDVEPYSLAHPSGNAMSTGLLVAPFLPTVAGDVVQTTLGKDGLINFMGTALRLLTLKTSLVMWTPWGDATFLINYTLHISQSYTASKVLEFFSLNSRF